MVIQVKPTRSELINLKKKIKLAKMGHSLLKRRKDGLIQEFFSILENVKNQRKQLGQNYRWAVSKLEIGRALDGTQAIESISLAKKTEPEVVIQSRSVMGVKVPKIGASFEKMDVLEKLRRSKEAVVFAKKMIQSFQ